MTWGFQKLGLLIEIQRATKFNGGGSPFQRKRKIRFGAFAASNEEEEDDRILLRTLGLLHFGFFFLIFRIIDLIFENNR